MRGRSLTVSYNLAATERASPSPGNSLFSSSIFIYASQNQLRGENASIGSLSKISPHPEQMRKFGSCWGWKRNRQQQVRGVGWATVWGRSGFLRSAAHKGVSSFGRNDGLLCARGRATTTAKATA